MNKLNNNHPKKKYLSPEVICVELDNEISLVLTSAPPEGPEEGHIPSMHQQSDPYKSNNV